MFLSYGCQQKIKKTIYFFLHFVYDNPNRVGDPALSATGTGSCPEDEGFAAMRFPHPLLHMGTLLICSNDTRSGSG